MHALFDKTLHKQPDTEMGWNMPSMYRTIRGVVSLPVRALFPAHVVGRENLPAHGPFIVAAGPHRSELESVILACSLAGYDLQFFAKSEYWRGSKLRRRFMDSTGMIPIDRKDSRAAVRQIQRGVDVLKAGGIVAMYPEGTRGTDEFVHKGHTGAVRMAFDAGNVPIVPVGMIGMRDLNPPGEKFRLRPGRCTIVIGKPMYPLMHAPGEHMESKSMDRAMSAVEKHPILTRPAKGVVVRIVTDQLMKEIARLSVSHYLDEYLEIGASAKPA